MRGGQYAELEAHVLAEVGLCLSTFAALAAVDFHVFGA